MKVSRRSVVAGLSMAALGYRSSARAQSAGRALNVSLAANSVGIHIPVVAGMTEILPTFPGYAPPKLIRMEQQLTQVQALIAGQCDIAVVDAPPVVRAIEAGANIKMIGYPDVGSSLVFVVNADVVQDFSDLAKPDVIVAVDMKGGAPHIMLVGPLLKRGIDLSKVTVVEIGGSGSRTRALLAKRAHAVPVHFDQAAEILKQGNYKILFEPAKEYKLWMHETIAVSTTWLEKPENKRAAIDFIKGTLTSHRRTDEDSNWYAQMYRKHGTDPKAAATSDEQLNYIWKHLTQDIKAFPKTFKFEPSIYSDLTPVYVAAGAGKGTANFQQAVDTSFYDAAVKELA